jgi:hypothetical protein
MTMTGADLGVLGNLAEAIGLFDDGAPNSDWFGRPDHYLAQMLSDDGQRTALVEFVDDVLGGEDRATAPGGTTWLPVVSLRPPDDPLYLDVCVTIGDQPAADGTPQPVRIGLGLAVRTTTPVVTRTTLEIPLFQVDGNGVTVSTPFLLGQVGGRIRIGATVVVDTEVIDEIGIDLDIPTNDADADPGFGLTLTGLQLPGAPEPRDIRVSADGADELDDAVLDLVLSLVRSLVSGPPATPLPGGPATPTAHEVLTAVAGMLGLVPGDAIPDFPIAGLVEQGPPALTAWLHSLLTEEVQRERWIGYLADLFSAEAEDSEVVFTVPGTTVALRVGVRVDTGEAGHAQVTPTLGVDLTQAGSTARAEARADLCTIDLVTGAAVAVPRLGIWAALGSATDKVLEVAGPPVVRADRLRLGFALDAQRRPTFVVAADTVAIGGQEYAVLDLTNPDALMDAAGAAVADIADDLLGNLGVAVQVLLGIGNAPGMTAPTLSLVELATDPIGKLSEHWQQLLADHRGDVALALDVLREGLSDATASAVDGQGSAGDPWRVGLVGPLALLLWTVDDRLVVDLVVTTSVDTLGGNAPVIEGRLGVRLAEIELGTPPSASLLTGVQAQLGARLRDVTPSQARLDLGEGLAVKASRAGLRFGWSAAEGLAAAVDLPELSLEVEGEDLPIALPEVAADGTVTLPAEGWDLLQQLVGHLQGYLPGIVKDVTDLLGWTGPLVQDSPVLRLSELVEDPGSALRDWAAALAVSELAPSALALLADLLTAADGAAGLLAGSGHPDDPFRLDLGAGVLLPEVAVWFPPLGLRPRGVNVPDEVRNWFPGQPGLESVVLLRALELEAEVASDVAELIESRDVAGGLDQIALRWRNGDGRTVPPTGVPAGVTRVLRFDVAAGQLLEELSLTDELGRSPTAAVYVALGEEAWQDRSPDRVVDLTAPGLQPAMFTAPTAAAGDWFVRLGSRAACKLTTGDPDGTAGQSARLRVLLDRLSTLGTDLVVVGVAGAGHACREAAAGQPAVSEVVTLGTPYGPVSLSALTALPEADGLRLLHRLLPPPPTSGEREDTDLRLARALVDSLMELVTLESPGADLAPAVNPPPARAGLETTAVFGEVSEEQISRAVTAAVVAGLAHRARLRAQTPLPPATGIRAGVRFVLPDSPGGTLRVRGNAVLTVIGLDVATDTDPARVVRNRELRLRAAMTDRLGWLTATPSAELRKITADVLFPLGGEGGAGPGTGRVVLHDARVLSQSWEQLVVGREDSALVPEARTLLAAAMQRLQDVAAGQAAVALAALLDAAALTVDGATAFDAVDQLVRDPGGLFRSRLASGLPELSSAVTAAIGLPDVLDLATGTVHVTHTATTGRFGWSADVTAGPGGLAGTVAIGPAAASGPAGALRLLVDLAPYVVRLSWHRPGGDVELHELWPQPDAPALARALVDAAPSLGGHVAVEILRGLDEDLRPLVDGVLDAIGLLSGTASDLERHLRPLVGLIDDPAGWLRSPESLAGSPPKLQALLDALRPLAGIAGNPGEPWPIADGVSLAVTSQGAGARFELKVDAGQWAPAGGADVGGGLTAVLTVGPSGPPGFALDAFVGLPGQATPGLQAVHVELGAGPVRVYFRPATGADIALVPFAGLGGLADAAAYALPFLLDALAADDTVGAVVSTVGDALSLRSPTAPQKFDHDRLVAWATNPATALLNTASTLAVHLADLATEANAFSPADVSITHTDGTLSATSHGVTLAWRPSEQTVSISGLNLAVPGIDKLTFRVAVSGAGLQDLTVTLGPAEIDAGDVTLRPFVTVAAGDDPVGGRRVAVGLAASDTARFAAKWTLGPPVAFDLVGSTGPINLVTPTVEDPDQAALRAVEVVADLVAAIAMSTPAVTDLLEKEVFTSSVRELLQGVLLDDAGTALIAGLFDPATLVSRGGRLFENIAGAGISIPVEELTVTLLKDADDVIGLKAEIEGRWALLEDDICLWLENDDSWIDANPPGDGGLFVGFLDVSGGDVAFEPRLTVWGVGLRIGKSSGPLLDLGLTLESVALHAYADIGAEISGGAQLQLSNLAVSASGASGGNGIAAGIVQDTGNTPPQPAFSPAIAVQKHGTADATVILRAGVGTGPWWIAIQKGFGPLYIEQVGLGVELSSQRVDEISLFLDGSVSLFGLTCVVDDLQITYLVSKNDFFNPNSWEIDLAGLAVSADMAGLSIAGGLLKNVDQQTGAIEYLGMLLARFGVYGITIYGGYGEGVENGETFVAFFAVGSVVGPIGGPPAFFLTGIGGGFGINRSLIVPTDLSKFGDYPLIKALDVAAKPGNPTEELRALGQYFPMKRGNFWFAAGLSFNSFALVDGIAVVAVEVGDGLDINLLGLARMALPRPQAALVSIEIALLVRFSSSEGVLWVQGQLTDNSWLLYKDVRLTGGFAFVTWFKGEYRGQVVLTLGGYHPDFRRAGYPVVPRLGLRWQFGSNIVIQAGSYFALTSEALMAGGDFSASASFGWAWAEVAFGAHGIVFYDPFSYQVTAHARVDAGISVDIWPFGEISMSVHVGARVEVEGPDFHGRATIEVGPCDVTVAFGSSTQHRTPPLAGDAFVGKYLEPSPEGAITLSVITTFGVAPSGSGDPTPDGTSQRPFKVVAEFGLIVTSTVPVTAVSPAPGMAPSHPPSRTLGVAPMGASSLATTLTQSWQQDGAELAFPFVGRTGKTSAFPVGVWGPPQDDNNRKVPKGDVIMALSEVSLDAWGTESAGGPQIPYHQVEIGRRIPLPFSRTASQVATLKAQAQALQEVVTSQPATVDEAFRLTRGAMARTASPAALDALRGERQAPPRLGTLGEGLDADAITIIPDKQDTPAVTETDSTVRVPVVVGLMHGTTAVASASVKPATTVKDASRLWRTSPQTLAKVDAMRSRSIAATLVVVDAVATPVAANPRDARVRSVARPGLSRAAARAKGSVVPTGVAPPTAVAHGPLAQVAQVGGAANERLTNFGKALSAGRRTPGDPGAVLEAGDVAVLKLPNARHDVGTADRPGLGVAGSPVRVLAIGPGADVLADTVVPDAGEIEVPQGAERLVAIGQGTGDATRSGLDGWHAGAQLPYLGWSSALGRGCLVRSRGEAIQPHSERVEAGWVTGAELARGVSTVTTRFTTAPQTVVIVLDDPTALGGESSGRRLVLGLDGADRVKDARGQDVPPVLLASENRSVLAYAVAPTAGPVSVTVACEQGWSLVGVLASSDLGPDAAVALISARGLDAALSPFVPATSGSSRLVWRGTERPNQRRPRRRRASTERKAG